MKSALYVHIPFCNAKCDYCDFYSLAKGSRDQKNAFTRALVRQLNHSCEKLDIDEFSTVYFGGGTPTSLTPESLEIIFSAINTLSGSTPIEWTIEVNPESLRREHLDLFSAFPLTRISMGVQSLYGPSRDFLGRRGSLKAVWTAFELLLEYWSGGLSIDLIRGLPESLSLPLEAEISMLPLYGIEHLSIYDLSLEEGTLLAARVGKIEPRRDILPAALESRGFLHYEVSNYSRPGNESRHNRSYWDMDPFLGIGPGAVSLLCEKGTWMQQRVRQNLDLYLRGEIDECLETEIPDGLEFFIEHLFMGLRQVRGISLERIEERFGLKLHDIIPKTLCDWGKSLSTDGQTGRLSLVSEAFWIQDRFFLDAWRELETHNPFA
jgi:oxygen-independent coproporphyrinogen-3 oxidase